MSKRIQQSLSTSITNRNKQFTKANTGIVLDVITSDTHPRVVEGFEVEGVETLRTDLVGMCIIRPLTDSISSKESLRPIKSYNTDIDLPIIGEIVELVKTGGTTYYNRLSSPNINSGNASENRDVQTFGVEPESKSSDYSSTSSTGISNSDTSNDRSAKFGEYFQPQQINPLRLYEGDKLIQSRFGQSIRFSGYNNTEEEYSPTIIIRNRQNDESINDLDFGSITEENVNKDGSTIALTSNKYKLDFQPGLVDDGGSSDFETTPINFKLPQEYVGFDQMLLNSERIIISAKSQEMIFFSKGNYGFISDGKFTIDNGNGGADLDFGDTVNITTGRNNSDFTINTGNGSIYLNTVTKDEPLVRGESLVELLTELIDAINKQVYNTPAGPTAVGPTNRADFNDIKSRLRDVLSTLNFTE